MPARPNLDTLLAEYPDIDTADMGFPRGWENEPLWHKSQKEFRLNSGSLKPEFSQFAGFKLSELNMRKQNTAEERGQKRPGSGGASCREKPERPGVSRAGLKGEAKNVLAQGPAGYFLSG